MRKGIIVSAEKAGFARKLFPSFGVLIPGDSQTGKEYDLIVLASSDGPKEWWDHLPTRLAPGGVAIDLSE